MAVSLKYEDVAPEQVPGAISQFESLEGLDAASYDRRQEVSDAFGAPPSIAFEPPPRPTPEPTPTRLAPPRPSSTTAAPRRPAPEQVRPFQAVALKQEYAPREPATLERQHAGKGYDILGGFRELVRGFKRLPKAVAAGIASALQGYEGASVVEEDFGDFLISQSGKESEKAIEDAVRRYGKAKWLPGIDMTDVVSLPDSLAASLTSAGAGILTGLGVAAAAAPTGPAAPVAGWVAGTTAAGTAAYQMTGYEVMKEYLTVKNEESKQKFGRGVTLDEEKALKKDFAATAKKIGLWEAIPEAAGQALGLGIIFNKLVKVAGKPAAARIIAKLAAFYGEEEITEMVTYIGTKNERIAAGLDDDTPAEWTDPGAYIEAFKETMPQTFLLSTIMGGAASGSHAIHKNRNAKKDAVIIKDAVAEKGYEVMPTADLEQMLVNVQKTAKLRPSDRQLQSAVKEMEDHLKARTGPQPAVAIEPVTGEVTPEVTGEVEVVPEEVPAEVRAQLEVAPVEEPVAPPAPLVEQEVPIEEVPDAVKAQKVQEAAERREPTLAPTDRINGITREIAGKMIAAGDVKVLDHIREGVELHGARAIEHVIQNQIITALGQIPKAERAAAKGRIRKLQPEIDRLLRPVKEPITKEVPVAPKPVEPQVKVVSKPTTKIPAKPKDELETLLQDTQAAVVKATEKTVVDEAVVPAEEPLPPPKVKAPTLEELEIGLQEVIDRVTAKVPKTTKTKLQREIDKQLGVTRDTTLKSVVEAAALKDQIRMLNREAKKAERRGRNIEALKNYFIIQNKLHLAKEKRALAVQFNAAIKKLTKPVSGTVDIHYQEAITLLTEGIDLRRRSKKTLKTRERQRAFLETGDPKAIAAFPKKLRTLLEKKPLNDMTIEEMEQIVKEREHLEKLGTTKRQLRTIGRVRDFRRTLKAMRKELAVAKPLTPPTDEPRTKAVRKAEAPGALSKLIGTTKTYILRPTRLLRNMVGSKKDSVFEDVFYDRYNAAVNETMRKEDGRKEAMTKTMADLGLTMRDLGKTRQIGGKEFTIDEMIDIYMGDQNTRKKLAIVYGNKIPTKMIEEIKNNLVPAEKKLGDAIIRDYADNYTRLREAKIDVDGKDLGYEANYSPITRILGITNKNFSEEMAEDLLFRKDIQRAFLNKGFSIPRKDVPKAFQKELRLGAMETWLGMTHKQERFINQGSVLKDMNRLINSKTLAGTIEKTHGKEYVDALRHYVNTITQPGYYESSKGLAKVSRFLRGNAALAYLSWNVLTMGKQLPSVLLYLGHASPGQLMTGMGHMIQNPKEAIAFVNERSPQLKNRSIERELEELKVADKTAYEKLRKKFGEHGMKGIYAIDRVAITIGWRAVYEQNVTDGKSEAEAIQAADKATFETQPQAHPKDLARLYTSNEVLNLFTQFSNQLSNIANIMVEDIPGAVRREGVMSAEVWHRTLGLGMASLVIYAMTNKDLPDELEEIPEYGKNAAIDQALNATPLFGRYLMSGRRGWSSDIPVLEGAKGLGAVFLKDPTKKESKSTKALIKSRAKKLFEALAPVAGIAFIGPKRAYEAVRDLDPRKLLGKKPSAIVKAEKERARKKSTRRKSIRQVRKAAGRRP